MVAVYANNLDRNIFVDEINYLCHKLNLISADNYYVIAGDLNARHPHWGDRVCNKKGELLKKWYDDDSLIFRTKIISPNSATFPSANSFLDLYLIDNRMTITDLDNNKIRTLDYNSNHKVLIFTLNLTHNPIDNNTFHVKHRHMYKKTKWSKFTKHLKNTYNANIPSNRNLNIAEIDEHLEHINSTITKAIEKIVPSYKPNDNILNYTNLKIKQLTNINLFLSPP